jgi:hypothetical protein
MSVATWDQDFGTAMFFASKTKLPSGFRISLVLSSNSIASWILSPVVVNRRPIFIDSSVVVE